MHLWWCGDGGDMIRNKWRRGNGEMWDIRGGVEIERSNT